MKRRVFFGAAVGAIGALFSLKGRELQLDPDPQTAILLDAKRRGFFGAAVGEVSCGIGVRRVKIFPDANPRYVGTINPKTLADRNMLMSFYGPLPESTHSIESDSSLRDARLDKARMDAIFKAFVEQHCS